MTRNEAAVLVSRALACIQLISAVLDASYLPSHFISIHHHAKMIQQASTLSDKGTFELEAYYLLLDRVDIAFFFGRIAFLLLMALIFWNCGPRIARFLLPERKSPPPSA